MGIRDVKIERQRADLPVDVIAVVKKDETPHLALGKPMEPDRLVVLSLVGDRQWRVARVVRLLNGASVMVLITV